jgi:DnaJ like chaperone protein
VIYGKLIGGLLGLFSAGIFGAVIGVAAGHFFDKSFGKALGFDFAADRERIQQLFFETSFTIMGHIAKADGRISEEEIAQTEILMTRLGLTSDHRARAIELFKLGSQDDFQLEATVAKFINEGGRQRNLPVLLLEFLFSVALADGELHVAEQEILSRTAGGLGINPRHFERLLSMLTAQQQFRGQYHQFNEKQAPRIDELENAYKALGVNPTDGDREIKRAYRKLMSQHHPDKLIAQGVPEDMLNIATEKAQEIQTAYDLVKSSRK